MNKNIHVHTENANQSFKKKINPRFSSIRFLFKTVSKREKKINIVKNDNLYFFKKCFFLEEKKVRDGSIRKREHFERM